MDSFCIIGLGRFGQTLACTLAQSGHQVMVIDYDSDKVNAIADIVTNAVVGDPTSEALLRASGVKEYDCAVICLSTNINDNILVTLMLKDLNVPKVVTRAISEQHKRVLEKIGADVVVFPEQDMGEKLAHLLSRKNVLDYFEFSDDYSIVEIYVPKKWIGKSLLELDVRKKYGVTIIAVRDTETGEMDVSPSPSRNFTEKNTVAVMGTEEEIDKMIGSV